MQWWYYRGQVTTPIDIPGKGPTVLRPRDKFQAPFTAVAHLRRLKKVVPCKPPEEAEIQASEPKSQQERAVTPPTVVASKAEPKAEVVEKEKAQATVEESTQPKATALQEKEPKKEKETRSRRKKS